MINVETLSKFSLFIKKILKNCALLNDAVLKTEKRIKKQTCYILLESCEHWLKFVAINFSSFLKECKG